MEARAVEAALEVTRHGQVAVVALTRGKVNAIDVELLDELCATLDRLERDDDVGAVVLTGAGRVFSAGVDLRRVVDGDDAYAGELVAGLATVFETLFRFSKPTVAGVNGAAVAGGCVMACACDRRVMARGASIGASELVVGVPFPASAVEILRHACGPAVEDVVFSGRLVDAGEAQTLGLVHEVVEADAVLARATVVAEELAARAPTAFALAKEQLRRPALERMRGDGPALDAMVGRTWAAPATRQRIRAQLDRISTRH